VTDDRSTSSLRVGQHDPMGTILVAGGGMCGMAAAMMLADDGHEVTVLERDPAPPPPDPETAFESWERRGVAQFHLGHWLHARGTSILRERLPRAHELLDRSGGFHFNLVEYVTGLVPSEAFTTEPGDERYDQLTGRRATLEWAMATAAADHPRVTVRRGDAISGFKVGASVVVGVPHVAGLRLATGEEFDADLVVDATGRRSPTPDWLADVGAQPPLDEAEDSGFAYYGRYLRSADGSMPPMLGPLLSPYGSMSILVLPSDNGTWALTVYGLADDKPLRRVRDPEVFERVIRSCPLHEHWLDGEPIGDMESMAGVVDRHRQFVVDGMPCATGVLTVADASSCTNPSLGRGITLGFMHVKLLRECIARHLDDPFELAIMFHERTEAEMRPWHDATTAIDRRRVREMRIYRDGGVPEPSPQERVADVMQAAITHDPAVLRGFADMFTCNALPADVMARPGMLDRIVGLADQVSLEPAPGPSRDELLELLS
jgi:2-polyprenyl-6-methoxyphenol hydroxylase-like FAD-dependent oxidoreductase